jgi:hypothetical protein
LVIGVDMRRRCCGFRQQVGSLDRSTSTI